MDFKCIDRAKREKRINDARAVPEKVKDAVLREVKTDEEQCRKTTSKFVLDIFSQQGHEVKADFVRKFLHANGKSLRKPTARTASDEIEERAGTLYCRFA